MSERCVLRERLVEAGCERASLRASPFTVGLILDALAANPRLLLAFAAEGLSDEDWAAMVERAGMTNIWALPVERLLRAALSLDPEASDE